MKRQMSQELAALAICLALDSSAQAQDSTSTPQRTLSVVATSHLDTQWRWTIQKTIQDYIPATARDNFKLFEEFPDYTFSFEGAFRYMLLKEYYQEEYRKLKDYIAAGRWRVAGSWVDAVDVNIPSAESLIRQTLYGNGFFHREKRCSQWSRFHANTIQSNPVYVGPPACSGPYLNIISSADQHRADLHRRRQRLRPEVSRILQG